MIDSAQLHALATVLRAGSFDAAAAELGVTPSAVSQRIRALEERIGAVLVERSQPTAATKAGARLARHAEAVRLMEQAVAADLGIAFEGAVSVRIAVNADSLATWFLPALAALPDLLFDLVSDDQDHSALWLRRGEVAAAVTGHADPVQGCDSLALGRLRYIATASPEFIAQSCPAGFTPEAIAKAPGLTYDAKDDLQSRWLQAQCGRRLGYRTHMIPSTQGFVEAALLGIGWGMNPEVLVHEHIGAGRLIALGAPLDVPLYWQVSRLPGAALAGLTAAVMKAARGALQ